MALGDCHRALSATGAAIERVSLVGGGAGSRLWSELVASAIGMPLRRAPSASVGPALGAARLARHGIGGPLVAGAAGSEEEIAPLPAMTEALAGKRQRFAAHLALR
jgi:xylulokinase